LESAIRANMTELVRHLRGSFSYGGQRGTAVVMVGVVLAVLLTVSRPAALPQEQDPLAAARVKEMRALVTAVYAVLRGRLVPAERPLGWSNDFFKGQDGNTFVPFTLTVERAKLSTSTVAMYILVTPRADAASGPTEPSPDSLEPEEIQGPPPPKIAFEAASFVDLNTETRVAPGGTPVPIRRGFSLPAGDYDVYVALAASWGTATPTESKTAGEDAKVMMIKQGLSVPNLWTTELSTSTVVVAERVEPLQPPSLTPDQQASDPYALGTVRIVPTEDTDFRKTDQLSVIFFVYNTGLTSARKPDVTVDYSFYQRSAGGERYYSKTVPQNFNAQTLPGFDIDAGHQLVAGQSIPLQIFPEGAYRLEIKVTDNARGSTVTRHVDFAVQ
jgi:hypothetical protein